MRFYYFQERQANLTKIAELEKALGKAPVSLPVNKVVSIRHVSPDEASLAFTMTVDGVKITEDALRDFLVALPETVRFMKKEGLALYDAMIIHGLITERLPKSTFVQAVNGLADGKILSYNDCKNFDDLEFHKPTDNWTRRNVTNKKFRNNMIAINKRKKLVRDIEEQLLKLKAA